MSENSRLFSNQKKKIVGDRNSSEIQTTTLDRFGLEKFAQRIGENRGLSYIIP